MSEPRFAVDVYQNEYLAEGGRDVSGIVTVTSAENTVIQNDLAGAEIIIIDSSGSMAPRGKIGAAREATMVALDVIRDGVAFAVITGNHRARPLFPGDGSLAIAGPQTRAAAKEAVAGLRAGGGTSIGQWLRLAHQIFTGHPDELRHAILLTDGKNGESGRDLDQAISLCEGVFSCDCRGIGTSWKVTELRKIAAALLGTVDIVADPAGLVADFESMMAASMSKQIADVALRVWTPQHAEIGFVRQVAPAVEDLTGRRTAAGTQAGDYPTGAWGAGESRDYHLSVRVSPAAEGQEMLAARISVVADGQVEAQGLVRAVWTSDQARSAQISQHVAHYTGQAELAEAIREGLEARKRRQGHGDRPARPGRGAGPPVGQRGHRPADRRGGGRRGRGVGHGPAEEARGRRGRDGPGYSIDQDGPDEEVTRDLPAAATGSPRATGPAPTGAGRTTGTRCSRTGSWR
jgi:hypothetical protein